MSNSLFPIKAMQFAHLLREVPNVVAEYNKAHSAPALGGSDGYSRMVMGTPSVTRVIRAQRGKADFRVRFAFATKWVEYPHKALMPRLEIYSLEGELLEATEVSELPSELSLAVEVELMHVVLISKDVRISML
jgi:hypothetical protein